MITPVDIFRPCIWQGEFDFSQLNLNAKLGSAVGEFGDVTMREVNFSTSSPEIQPHSWQEFSPFLSWVNDAAEEIWKQWNLVPLQRYITNSHVNKITAGKGLREHAHPGVDLVVTGYISVPEGAGNIEIRDPNEYQWQNLPIDGHPSQVWKEVPVKTNTVLIFPGWLNHRTQASITDDPRWVVTMMIRSRLAQG
jgi:hypothetical protein